MSGREGSLEVPIRAGDRVRGAWSAPLTLLEYGDYECKFCRAAFPVVEQVREQLGERLRFVFRHFPLSHKHARAQLAAEAAEAAREQGAFWPMHRLLYTRTSVLELRDPEA